VTNPGRFGGRSDGGSKALEEGETRREVRVALLDCGRHTPTQKTREADGMANGEAGAQKPTLALLRRG
jgi:hypothetical protein